MRRISGSLTPVMQIGFFRLDDNSTVPVITQPNFEVVQYSKEALYLWARSGDPYALKWLTLAARHIAARVEIIGGSRGIDQCSPLKGRPDGLNNDAVDDGSGSRFPVGLAVSGQDQRVQGERRVLGRRWKDGRPGCAGNVPLRSGRPL